MGHNQELIDSLNRRADEAKTKAPSERAKSRIEAVRRFAVREVQKLDNNLVNSSEC